MQKLISSRKKISWNECQTNIENNLDYRMEERVERLVVSPT